MDLGQTHTTNSPITAPICVLRLGNPALTAKPRGGGRPPEPGRPAPTPFHGSHTIRTLPSGPVLGIVPGAEYPEETFTLEEGTALVMVTDGVVEGPRLTLDAGLERAGALAGGALKDRLGVEATADRILDAVAAVDHLDDVAVLVIRRA
ncbi:SpoIIE family protein phosphatase [Streptomyces sp. NBC_01483]|uniref:SpoIIE family protein phosphatase n=1 Tax=Streptomyces sp. NBC_01483 TaxID=2903883 RepID=UPI002E2EE090|nr:SpoIIE family protein phosphatase [Streptomyces sp. NBC_01483]